MPKFGEVLFGGSRFIFWALSPFLALFAIVMPVMIETWNATYVILVVGLDTAAALLILALYNPRRFWWAARTVTGMVFPAYLAYILDEIHSGKPWTLGPRTEAAPLNALEGFSVIGIPCLLYTVLGRFRRREQPKGDS